MTSTHNTQPTAVDRFWEKFADRARKSGVKDGAIRWYVRHAGRHLQAFSDKRLAERSLPGSNRSDPPTPTLPHEGGGG